MRKRKRASQPRAVPHPEQQLAGLREHTQAQRQSTVDRLAAAIASLTAQKETISARTIREECGLEYASIRRNPAALLLYKQHSTFLQRKRKRTKTPPLGSPAPRIPSWPTKSLILWFVFGKNRRAVRNLKPSTLCYFKILSSAMWRVPSWKQSWLAIASILRDCVLLSNSRNMVN